MRILSFVILLSIAVGVFVPHGLMAQEISAEPLDIRSSGEAYLSALRYRRIDTDVRYFDPSQPAPELKTSETPRTRDRSEDNPEDATTTAEGGSWLVAVVSLVIFAFLLGLFLRFGGPASITFQTAPEIGALRRTRARVESDASRQSESLEEILRIEDRRVAIVALSNYLLGQTVAAEGILWQQSWTARDAMAKVPRTAPLRDALFDLVLSSERVHFGGRDVTETEFTSHVDRLRPFFAKLAL